MRQLVVIGDDDVIVVGVGGVWFVERLLFLVGKALVGEVLGVGLL